MRPAVLLLLAALTAAAETACELDAWPAIIGADEAHRLAFRLVAAAEGTAQIAWDEADGQPFRVPAGTSSGLLPLPRGLGLHRGEARVDGAVMALAVRLADAAGPWPITGLRHGLPVDAAGVPVVLVDRRRSPNDARRERLAGAALPRPAGRALLVGDPLTTPDGSPWRGLSADLRPAVDARYPQHAALVALSAIAQPRTIMWCPGNAALFAGTTAEEARLFSALAHRCTALAIAPRLVLALPPWPVAAVWREAAERRRQQLADSAQAAGWTLLDLAASAGEAPAANRMVAGLYAEYPVGDAQLRVSAALRDELAR